MVVTFQVPNAARRQEHSQPSELARQTAQSGFAFTITVPHASGDVPHWQTQLAASIDWLDRAAGTHHALDRGAALLGRAIGTRLAAPVIEGEFSRLFIDLNRPLEDPSAIVEQIDGQSLAFNAAITAGDLAARRMAHRRIHQRIDAVLESAAVPTFLVDQHSFDRFGPAPSARIVDIGVCAPGDDRFARELLACLLERTHERPNTDRANPQERLLNVRLNEPYSADHPGAYIMRRHMPAAAGGVVIEVCDDLLTDEADIAAIADLLTGALAEAASALVTTGPTTAKAAGDRA